MLNWLKNNKIIAWFLGLVIAVIVGYALFSWRKKLKELAEAKTKLEQLEVEAKKKAVLDAVNKAQTQIATINNDLNQTLKDIAAKKEEITQTEIKYQKTISEIKDIQSWDDLVQYRKNHP